MEVKHPKHDLTEDDLCQAISYARLLRGRVAPYAIVTNGRDTKVYKPLANSDDPLEITIPADAMWDQAGRSVAAIDEELRHKAARKLIGINPDTLRASCRDQVQWSIEDLKGTGRELKEYIPELHLPRVELEHEFSTWLQMSAPCFAVVAESGVGKGISSIVDPTLRRRPPPGGQSDTHD